MISLAVSTQYRRVTDNRTGISYDNILRVTTAHRAVKSKHKTQAGYTACFRHFASRQRPFCTTANPTCKPKLHFLTLSQNVYLAKVKNKIQKCY